MFLKKMIFPILLFLIVLTSCNSNTPPERVKYKNETYMTGFYSSELTACDTADGFIGDLYNNSKEVWNSDKIKADGLEGYKIDYSNYQTLSLLYGVFKHYLYVKEEDYNEAKEYYEKSTTFNYFIATGPDNDISYSSVYKVNTNEEYVKNFDDLIKASKDEKIKVDVENIKFTKLYIYKISKDGLLTTYRETYYFINNQLYIFDYFDGNDDSYHFFKIKESLSKYFIGYINDYIF